LVAAILDTDAHRGDLDHARVNAGPYWTGSFLQCQMNMSLAAAQRRSEILQALRYSVSNPN
jgi:hypothetical protein